MEDENSFVVIDLALHLGYIFGKWYYSNNEIWNKKQRQ